MTERLWASDDTSALLRSCSRIASFTISSFSASGGGVAAYIGWSIVELFGLLCRPSPFLLSTHVIPLGLFPVLSITSVYDTLSYTPMASKYSISLSPSLSDLALVKFLVCSVVIVSVSSQVRNGRASAMFHPVTTSLISLHIVNIPLDFFDRFDDGGVVAMCQRKTSASPSRASNARNADVGGEHSSSSEPKTTKKNHRSARDEIFSWFSAKRSQRRKYFTLLSAVGSRRPLERHNKRSHFRRSFHADKTRPAVLESQAFSAT